MSVCRVFSSVVGVVVCYDQYVLLFSFALLHSVLQGQIFLLLQVFLTSYFCIPVPYNEKDIFFRC